MSKIPVTQESMIAIAELKKHPRNYRVHPEDELDHLMESIQEHGFYRNIVIANDNTILAGHGVVEAARQLDMTHVPFHRVDYDADDPRAIKLLIGDNEISHLTNADDRLLSELLRELNQDEIGLLGTGYDEMMLANLALVTRPASEIADLEAAEQWVGMPEYDLESESGQIQVAVHFVNEEDRLEFFRLLGLDTALADKRKSLWWPERKLDDSASIRFTDSEGH